MSDYPIRKVVFVSNGHDEVLVRWALKCLSEACGRVGVVSKTVDIAAFGWHKEMNDADVVVVYRSFDFRTLRMMKKARMEGSVVGFFLDDYLFQPDCKYTKGWSPSMETMAEADFLMSSSSFLLSKMPFDKPKVLRRSVLTPEASKLLKQEYRRTPGTFAIGWLAGRGRTDAMDGFVSECLKEMDAGMSDEERCVFHCFGVRSFPKLKRVIVKERVFFAPNDWEGLYSYMKLLDLGVAINPLDESDDFCKCKSELKLVETGVMGVPMVTSRVPPYLGLVREGETGFFASTPKEFAEKTLLVMRDEVLSRKVSTGVGKLIAEGYDADMNARNFLAEVSGILNGLKRRS